MKIILRRNEIWYFQRISNSSPYDIEIVQYDIDTESLIINPANADFRYSTYFLSSRFQIAPNRFFIRFTQESSYEVYENSELYSYDTKSPFLQEFYDFNQTTQTSNPINFTESPSFLYFIARTAPDNSYQLYATAKAIITSVSSIGKERLQINVHPNPASEFIALDNNADEVTFFYILGIEAKKVSKYSKNEQIDISNLAQGIYFIELIANKVKSSTSFIKN